MVAVNLDTTNITNNLQKPIVLIGMMGTGKTHLGKMLAEKLGLKFYDSDHVIEDRGGLSINEIFDLYGEQRFRQSEEKTILELLNNAACVIATGGGAPMNAKIMSAIKSQSLSIWLNSDADSIYERIKQAKNRPLLKNEDPKATLKKLISERQDIYAKADVVIQTNGNNAEYALNKIIKAIAENI